MFLISKTISIVEMPKKHQILSQIVQALKSKFGILK